MNLSGDVFDSHVADYTIFSNVPQGLTGVVSYISGTQLKISLVGTAVNHANSDDIDTLIVDFQTGAFLQHYPSGVQGSYRSDLKVDFWDPFVI
ncbi:MAG: hypothetical protein GXP45_01190 [bacterium]|nr:hypothetical protein [bacterium]